ncbi:endonuclease-reverse transcriptase domain-containing protein [Phthorimaea operculella]|nr:endonuclease-reverse transcriptase domain-containing protein [Phthorimaea operculella]
MSGAQAILGVVYCPPATKYFSDLESVLESIASEGSHHIILGDLNTNLLVDSSRAIRLRDLIESLSLHIMPLSATHLNLYTEDTLLDLIITSAPPLISTFGQCPAPGFSKHDLLYVSYILKVPKPKPDINFVSPFKFKYTQNEMINQHTPDVSLQ